MRILYLVFLLAVNFSAVAVGGQSLDVKALSETLHSTRLHYGASAAVLTVTQSDHRDLTLTDGTVSESNKMSVKASHLFQIGSITKSFIAVLMLKLNEQGLLNLDDAITQYLPQYEHWEGITIRQLLNHTSGIYNYTKSESLMNDLHQHLQKRVSPEYLVKLAYEKPLQFQPGKGWYYSNTNYVLAGMIIRKLTHQSIETLLNRRIIYPLHLRQTYFVPDAMPKIVSKQMVMGYTSDNHPTINGNLTWSDTSGALVSSSKDIARWIRVLFSGQWLGGAQYTMLIQKVSVQDGSKQPPGSRDAGYGLGIKYRYDEDLGDIWYHPGGTMGFTAIMIWLPSKHLSLGLTLNKDVNSVVTANHLADSILSLYKKTVVKKNQPQTAADSKYKTTLSPRICSIVRI